MKIFILVSSFILSTTFFFGQNIIFDVPSMLQANGTSGNRGPNGTTNHACMRGQYLVPATDMAGYVGSSIASFGFELSFGTGSSAVGQFTVWLLNTTDATYTMGTIFNSALMTQVYAGTYAQPSGNSVSVDFTFPTPFNYTGNGLYVAYEYQASSYAPSPSIYTCYAPASPNQGATGASTNVASAPAIAATLFRPIFRFGMPNFLTIAQTGSIACNGGATGAISSTVSGVSGAITYSWLPSGGNGATASNLTAGVYTCIATTTNNAKSVKTVTITEPPAIVLSIASQSNAICFGMTNGVAIMNASGGTGSLSYSWTPGNNNTTFLTNAAAGSYTFLAMDANNCSASYPVTITEPPSFSISGTASSPTLCSGNLENLTGSGASTYTWTGGVTDGQPFYVSSTSIITNTYTVTGTDASGCPASAPATVTVTVYPQPTVSVNSGAICAGDIFTITPTGAATYVFSSGSNTVAPVTNSSYSITGTSAAGCGSALMAIADVTVNPLPVVTANNATVCAGTLATIIPGGATTYTITGNNFSVTPSVTTSYSITGTSTEGCVNASPAVSTISVNPLPPVTANSSVVCIGSSVSIVPGGALAYTITNGAATYFSTGGSIAITPSVSVTYSILGVDAEGCLGLATSSITVNNLPIITVNNAAVCTGQSYTIIPSGALSYTYSTPLNNPVVTPTASGTYTIEGTDVNGCYNAATSSVTLNLLPVISVSISASVICEGEPVVLSASGAQTYSWVGVAAGSSATVTPAVSYVYTVSGTDANLCTGLATASVTVSICTGISQTHSNQPVYRVYPNPANGLIMVSGLEYNQEILVHNAMGQLIIKTTVVTDETTIDLSGEASGVYFISVSGVTKKIIKE